MASVVGINGDVRVANIIADNAFESMGSRFGFQKDNVRNQKANFVSIFSSFISKREEINLGPSLFIEQTPIMIYEIEKFLNQDDAGVKLVANSKKIAFAFCSMHEEYFRSYRVFAKYLYKSDNAVLKEGTVSLRRKIHTNSMRDMVDDLALAFLIWGEAGNARFLPEILKLLYFVLRNENIEISTEELQTKLKNNPKINDDTNTPFLDMFIKPLYEMIILDLETKASKNHPTAYDMPNDHDTTRNYDDLNEQAFTRPMFIVTLFKNLWNANENKEVNIDKVSRFYAKTFYEKRGYLAIPRTFQRLCTLFIAGLSALIYISVRGRNMYDTKLNLYYIAMPVALFLAGNDLAGSILMGVEWERGAKFSTPEHVSKDVIFYSLIAIRIIFKIIVCLLIFNEAYEMRWLPLEYDFEIVSIVYLASLVVLESLYFINMGDLKPYARMPDFVNILLGTAAFNGPYQLAPVPIKRWFSYGFLWVLVIGTKLALDYFSLILPMVETHLLFLAEQNNEVLSPSRIDLTFFKVDDLMVQGSLQAVIMLGPFWLIVFMLYFANIEFFYVLVSTIYSTSIALHQHVGETPFDSMTYSVFNTVADLKAKLTKGLYLTESNSNILRKKTNINHLIIDSVSINSYQELATPTRMEMDQIYNSALSFKSGVLLKTPKLDIADSAKSFRPLMQKHISWVVNVDQSNLPLSPYVKKKKQYDLTVELARANDLKDFADEFNCIIMSWRDDDIISNSMVVDLQFVVSIITLEISHNEFVLYPAVIKPAFLISNHTLNKVTSHMRDGLSQTEDFLKSSSVTVMSKQLILGKEFDKSEVLRIKFIEFCLRNEIISSYDWERLVHISAVLVDCLLPSSNFAQVMLTTFYYARQSFLRGITKKTKAQAETIDESDSLKLELMDELPPDISIETIKYKTVVAAFSSSLFYRKDAETKPNLKQYLDIIESTGNDDDVISPMLNCMASTAELFKAIKVKESYEAPIKGPDDIKSGIWKHFRDMIAALTVIQGFNTEISEFPAINDILKKDFTKYQNVRFEIICKRPFLSKLQQMFHGASDDVLPDEANRRITFHINSLKSMTQLKDDRAVMVDNILRKCLPSCRNKKNPESSDDNVTSQAETDEEAMVLLRAPVDAPKVPKTLPQFHQPHAEDVPIFTTITPYYNEIVAESLATLLDPDAAQDGLNVLTYLKTIYDKEWLYLEERVCRAPNRKSSFESDLALTKITKQAFHNFLDNATQFTYAYITDLAEPTFLLELYAESYYGLYFEKASPRIVLNTVQKDFGLLFDIKLGEGTNLESTAILADITELETNEKDCKRFENFLKERFLNTDENLTDIAPRQRYQRFVQLARVMKEVTKWASRRGQTLYRTITGVMKNEEAIINQFLREINTQENPTIFQSPYYRSVFFKTAIILRDRSIVSKAVYDMLPEWLRDVSGIDYIFRDKELRGTIDLGLIERGAMDSTLQNILAPHTAPPPNSDCFAVLYYIMEELNLSDEGFAEKLIKAVLFSLGAGTANDMNADISGSMTFGLLNTAEELARKKFNYIITIQTFHEMMRDYDSAIAKSNDGTYPYVDSSGESSNAAKYAMIVELMMRFPGLQVTYVESQYNSEGGYISQHSKLLKYDFEKGRIKEEYSIELPGPHVIGIGKAENQNHALIFSRGEGLQALDMDQDLTLENAGKLGSLMTLLAYGKILGFKESVNTEELSTTSSVLAYMETISTSSSQRISAWLTVRQHYGHPDVLHRICVITNGGMSKASRVINTSEDIFCGYNFSMRGGSSKHYEFVTLSKAKDVSFDGVMRYLNQQAIGSSEQVLSRDVLRMAHQMDIFRHLSFYFTALCQQINAVWVNSYTVVFIYSILFLNMFNMFRKTDDTDAENHQNLMLSVLGGEQFALIFVLYTIQGLPLYVMERGAISAISKHVFLFTTGLFMFFPFVLGSRAVTYNTQMTYGSAEKAPTERGFGLKHTKFVDTFRTYYDVMTLGQEIVFTTVISMSMPSSQVFFPNIIQLIIGLVFLYSPFIFNPSQFDATMLTEDWNNYYIWMNAPASDINPDKSWNAWCAKRLARNSKLPKTGKRLWITLPILVRRILLITAMCINMDASQGTQRVQFTGPIGCFFLCLYIMVFFFVLAGLSQMFNKLIAYEETRASLAGSTTKINGDDYVSAEILRKLRWFASQEGLSKALINLYRLSRFVLPAMIILALVVILGFEAVNFSFILWIVLINAIILYAIAFDVYLSYFNCDNQFGAMPNSIFTNITNTVHIASATVTIAPVWLISILPFIDSLQYRMLYFKDFKSKLPANYEALKSERSFD